MWMGQGLASAVAVAVLAGGVGAQAPQSPAVANPPPKVAAVVNGESITMADVETVLKRGDPTPTELTALQRRQRELEALQMLIDDQLMQQFLRKNVARVEPAEVDKQLAELLETLKKSGTTLADFLRERVMTEAQLRNDMANMLMWTHYVKAHVTDADVKRYYDENKDFFDQVTVRASHIVIRVPATGDPAKVAAEREAARAKLVALRQDIVAGKLDFAEAAKKHSQCSSAPSGGDLGYFRRKWMLEENLAKTAFALKVGDVSEVVQTDYGLHLIKVTDRKPGQPSTYEKIKDDVREFYIEEIRQNLLAQQRKQYEAQIQINLH
jgi:peptidyl-prolyl cis-trans isomerase C